MYIIQEGEVNCMKGDRLIRTLKSGEHFGQKAIMESDKRTLDVVAKTECKLFSLSTEFFWSQLGDNYKEQLYFSFLSLAFIYSKYFSFLNKKLISKTFNFFSFKSFNNKEVIYNSGTNMKNKICVVLEGNIVDKNTSKVEAKRYGILFESKLYEKKLIKLKIL